MTSFSNEILYLQYSNPATLPPLHHSAHTLADAGWQVTLLGVESGSESNKLSFVSHKNVTVRRLRHQTGGWRQKVHYVRYAIWVMTWVLRRRLRWVYASNPLSCPIALILSYFPGVKIIYHEHDSPTPQAKATSGSAFFRLVRRARRRLARRAAACVLPNEERARHFADETGVAPHRVHCVWNCPARDEAKRSEEPREGDEVLVLYHGSLNEARLPFTVLEALEQFPDYVHLRVAGYETLGSEGYCDKLRKRASRLDIAHRLDILGAIPQRQELLAYARRCHIGLSFMPMEAGDFNLRHMAGASNKPFDYLACGLPLVVSDLPDWCELYVQPGYGLACDPRDSDSIAEVLRWYLEHPGERQAMGEAGRQRVLDEWNYEEQFSKVREVVRSA